MWTEEFLKFSEIFVTELVGVMRVAVEPIPLGCEVVRKTCYLTFSLLLFSLYFMTLTLKRWLNFERKLNPGIFQYHVRQNQIVWIIFCISDSQENNVTRESCLSFPFANISQIYHFSINISTLFYYLIKRKFMLKLLWVASILL